MVNCIVSRDVSRRNSIFHRDVTPSPVHPPAPLPVTPLTRRNGRFRLRYIDVTAGRIADPLHWTFRAPSLVSFHPRSEISYHVGDKTIDVYCLLGFAHLGRTCAPHV